MHRVRVTIQGHVHERIESLTDVQINILRLLGNEVCHLYQISPYRVAQCRVLILYQVE
jgi:hypothetical protein